MASRNALIESIANNWKLDAKMEDSSKYFFNYEEVNDIISNKKCYVIARKGAGKTAISEHIIRNKSYDSFAEKLCFKNFPFNELYNLSNNQYTTPNQYITLWKYLIYSTICKLMVQNENIDLQIRSELEKLYPKADKKLLSRKITEWTSIEFGASVFGNGGNIGIKRDVDHQQIPWLEKVNILEDVIMGYCDNSKYFIVFDELDEDYRSINGPDSILYINLITSLFKAVQDVKSTFAQSNLNIMPIVFLRDDIYALVKDSDKNKWSDMKIELEWNKEKIKKLLAYRISKDYGSGDLTFDEAWKLISTNADVKAGARQSKNISQFDFISSSTHLKPRDFIKYIQACCEKASEDNVQLIHPQIIKDVDRAFSNYLKDELKDELYPLLPDIDNIFQIISNIRKPAFKANEFVSEFNKYNKTGSLKSKNVDYVLDTLYNFSVIGNQHKTVENKRFFKYMHTNMTFNKSEVILIHRGLYKALQII